MPAGLPGSSVAENSANPSAGAFVIFDPLSGPKGSPFDTPGTIHASTGCMCNGIGMQSQPVINILQGEADAPAAIERAGYDDDQVPGTERDGAGTQNVVNSEILYLGGGRTVLVAGRDAPGEAGVDPYTAGIAIVGAGNGAPRDGGAGPAFTGFNMKMVTATAQVDNGDAVEAGWPNRSGVTIESGESVFGVNSVTIGAAS